MHAADLGCKQKGPYAPPQKREAQSVGKGVFPQQVGDEPVAGRGALSAILDGVSSKLGAAAPVAAPFLTRGAVLDMLVLAVATAGSARAAAAQLGIAETTISAMLGGRNQCGHKVAAALGVRVLPRTTERVSEMITLRRAGWSYPRIARELDVTRQAVHCACKRH